MGAAKAQWIQEFDKVMPSKQVVSSSVIAMKMESLLFPLESGIIDF
jgi:hypothetical protein